MISIRHVIPLAATHAGPRALVRTGSPLPGWDRRGVGMLCVRSAMAACAAP